MLDSIREQRGAIYELARKNRISKVAVFGSCARKEEHPGSDVDFLVDFMDGATLFDHVHMRDDLAELLKCDVDVVSRRGLHPYIRQRVLEEAITL